MESPEELLARLRATLPDAAVEAGAAAGSQPSLVVGREHLVAVGRFLRDDPVLRLDYCSNVTGVDWPERTEKVKVRELVNGVEKDVEQARTIPGYLEVVYHLYSMSLKHGPLVVRVRTAERTGDVTVPSLTPVWRACELQEREVYDLFGVVFDGHPDMRRLLMWEGFRGHPMRKDYVEPDDYEYEPTPHDQVLERAREHQARIGRMGEN